MNDAFKKKYIYMSQLLFVIKIDFLLTSKRNIKVQLLVDIIFQFTIEKTTTSHLWELNWSELTGGPKVKLFSGEARDTGHSSPCCVLMPERRNLFFVQFRQNEKRVLWASLLPSHNFRVINVIYHLRREIEPEIINFFWLLT
jgi:hypothetical protein